MINLKNLKNLKSIQNLKKNHQRNLLRKNLKKKAAKENQEEEEKQKGGKKKKTSKDDEEEGEEKEEKDEKEKGGKKKKGSKDDKEEYEIPASIFKSLTSAQNDELMGMKVDELKKRLEDNEQVTTGNKKTLQLRIADCIVNGTLPRCPKCFTGRVRYKTAKSFYCPGAYDDDVFKRCSWKSSTVKRGEWKTADNAEI